MAQIIDFSLIKKKLVYGSTTKFKGYDNKPIRIGDILEGFCLNGIVYTLNGEDVYITSPPKNRMVECSRVNTICDTELKEWNAVDYKSVRSVSEHRYLDLISEECIIR